VGPSPPDGSPRGAPSSSREISQIETRPRESGNVSQEFSLRQAMKDMSISILLYAENPSDRMVFINGRKYVEGDYVDGQYLLERITSDGVVLNYQGEQVTLKPKTD